MNSLGGSKKIKAQAHALPRLKPLQGAKINPLNIIIMKKTIISIVLLAMALCATAQEKTAEKAYKREGKTFVQSDTQVLKGDTTTTYLWRDSKGTEYPIILHQYKKGQKVGKWTAYVIRKSAKSGKEYRYFLPDGEKIANEILNETK